MAHERAREVGNADGRRRLIAELPEPTVQSVHELALARNDANRETTTDDFAVRTQVSLDAVVLLRTAWSETKAAHNLVEYEDDALLFRQLSELLQELLGTKVWSPTLNGLDQHRGELVGMRLENLHRLRRTIVEDHDVLVSVG